MKHINLFIDTTTNNCVIAIYNQDNSLIDFTIVETNKNLTDLVVEIILKLINQNGFNYQNIKNIFLNNGPGSFTGVRVGSIIAKTLSFSFSDINLYTCDSLRIYANHEKNALVFLDAKGQKSYYIEIIDDIASEYKIIENNDLSDILNKFQYKIINANIIDFVSLVKNLNFKNFKLTN